MTAKLYLLAAAALVLVACDDLAASGLAMGPEPAAVAPADSLDDSLAQAAVEDPADAGAGQPAAAAPAASVHIPSIDGRRSWSSNQSEAQLDIFLTARDERGWRILWQLVGIDPPGPLPEEAMAVGIFLGPRPTAGYGVRLVDVFAEVTQVVAVYEKTVPGPDEMVAQVITAPYAIQLMRAHDLPVRFLPLEWWGPAQQ